MIKKLLIILILFLAPSVYADTGYVSPETYAVNEADLLDYMEIPSAPKPDIDSLNSNKIFNKSNNNLLFSLYFSLILFKSQLSF